MARVACVCFFLLYRFYVIHNVSSKYIRWTVVLKVLVYPDFVIITFLFPIINIFSVPVGNKICYTALIKFYTGMEVDGEETYSTGTGNLPTAEQAARAAAMAFSAASTRRDMSSVHQVSANSLTPAEIPETQVKNSSINSGLFQQCSNAKLADRNVIIHSIGPGGDFCSEKVPVPRIGAMAVEGEADIAKLFHGARQMRGGQVRNEVMTATFDPATLNCVTCKDSHEQ
jgi:hypothetical protein